MALVVRKLEGETWRECAVRYAARYGLESEVLEIFDRDVAAGVEEGRACWNACYEWDVVEYEANIETGDNTATSKE